MKLIVYKGFSTDFLNVLQIESLIGTSAENKKNVLLFDTSLKKKLNRALASMDDDDTYWITYEEMTLIKDNITLAIKDYDLEVEIVKNNLYPDYYPVEVPLEETLLIEIDKYMNSSDISDVSDDCLAFCNVFNALAEAGGTLYAGYYNFEYDRDFKVVVKKYYDVPEGELPVTDAADINIFINDDIDSYLTSLVRIEQQNPKTISIQKVDGLITDRILDSLKAYCSLNDIKLYEYHEKISAHGIKEEELIDIARNKIGIPDFKEFRKLRFYNNPDIDNNYEEISQSQIITDIIEQAENSYNTDVNSFRDIFITASTGAGKSVMFQIPAVYLAEKYHKLTIIIEPVKALMQDQKDQLNKRGYTRVETFNSDLISQTEKEAVLKRIKDGEVDLLYLSPETLLSYSIETLIGDREIGLLIVDEAHIVTTWGIGFRPDYWYLGGYINSIRNPIKSGKKSWRRIQHFPICAFTATAVNGGIDDSISETIISLYMENPIKYVGYVKRDNIKFDITTHSQKKLPSNDYEEKKAIVLNERMNKWIDNREKTITYFPYAQTAYDAYRCVKGFSLLKTDRSKVGIYIGRNIDAMGDKIFADAKREAFEKFRTGENNVMFATKAFGMGVDVNNIQNVYHYAATGNLCDYVQEIGRAARIPEMTGYACMDYFYNDMNYIKALHGMSAIRQYQIMQVLSGVYNAYRNKGESRNFLIAPDSFTYVFTEKDESTSINKLKTCLLMLEKDLYDKYNFKVLISRPQSIFTKAFVCVRKEKEQQVLASKYGKYLRFVAPGRYNRIENGVKVSDMGDIFIIDLKTIWENEYQNISFPQFKYWYFNRNSFAKEKVDVMPEIKADVFPRQKLTIKAADGLELSQIRDMLIADADYIADALYSNFKKQYFTIQEMVKVLATKYGTTKARILGNSLFDLIDPDGRCVKHRVSTESVGATYTLSNGTFKEMMRKSITRASIMNRITNAGGTEYSEYTDMLTGSPLNLVALKLMSIFDYISYEALGGQEPEIFIRLNDPEKIRRIVMGEMSYKNGYVTRAGEKHDRDVNVLMKFFTELNDDEERWDYIERYFLGRDVLDEALLG